MFIPNGQGTVEWRLGFSVTGVGDHAVLIMPVGVDNLGVEVGVLTAASLRRMEATGFSIAVAPRAPVAISRGQEIARIVLLHSDSLRVRAEGETR